MPGHLSAEAPTPPDVFEEVARHHRELFLDEAVHAAQALRGQPLAPARQALLDAALSLCAPGRAPARPPVFPLAHALRYGGAHVAPNRAYYQHLDACGREPARELASLLAPAAQVLDAGCGAATYGRALLDAWPNAQVTALDRADALEAAAPPSHPRLHLRHGDLLHSALGGPYDVALLANVVHLLPGAALPALFTRLHDALRPGGLLVVKDLEATPDNEVAVLFNLSLVCFTDGDGMPPPAQVTALLGAAGFEVSRGRLASSPHSGLWFARRPTA